ncbi:MAG: hypothetical protein ACI8XO_001877 [Verrucomicrobiales bacterium]|jgi:hypothetical protein
MVATSVKPPNIIFELRTSDYTFMVTSMIKFLAAHGAIAPRWN